MSNRMCKYFSSVATTVWINRKNLKMNFLEYAMLVVLFPLTYLVISATSSDSAGITLKASGMLISMIISLFVNMQGSLIANANVITTRELYATYGVKPLHVYDGMSVFHFLMVLPMIALTAIICLMSGNSINYIGLVIWGIICFIFLSSLAIVLGGIIKNPRVSTPIISMCYMIIMIISPIYYSAPLTNIALYFNPFSWLCESLKVVLGITSVYNFNMSVLILLALSTGLRIISFKLCNDSSAIEKSTII